MIEAVDEAVDASGRAFEKAKLAVKALLLTDSGISAAALTNTSMTVTASPGLRPMWIR